ncbi:MAG: translation initiation factor IF-2, partial [Bacillota bacterium]
VAEAPKAEAPAQEAPRAEAPAEAPREAEAAPEQTAPGKSLPGPARSSGPAAGPSRPVPGGPGQPARPAASGLGLPTKPAPAPAGGANPALGLPSKPVPGGPGQPPRPAGASGLGLPVKPAPGAPRQMGDRGPRPGGLGLPERGPRPGGVGAPRPGGGAALGAPTRGPRRGGVLNIPKVDPKVAEQAKPADGKPRIGQGGDRKKGDAFTKRETAASRPSEEKLFGRRPLRQTSVVERRSLKPITITGSMTVKDLAHEMGVTAAEVIKKLLTGFGIMATINQELDTDTCVLVGSEFGIDVTVEQQEDIIEVYDRVEDPDEDPALKQPRHPVVTIMGHVDHGKTSLLDAIRSAKVAAGEAGGITQHIGAYEVELNGRKITFLDTPGHEAFTAMRARGANVTDIAILVVAADDSVMPQTIESINHAKAANVPILVAINKIDKENANPNRVMQDLTAYGLVSEEWGGETIMVPVSAKNKTNLDLLLENILILAEVQDLKANPDKPAAGTVIEAELDKNRGPVATVLVQGGTLNLGDTFVAGTAWGRVRAMFDHRGKRLKSAGPSTPVQVLGFDSVPAAGDVFRVTPDEKTAKAISEKRIAKAQAERQASKAISLDDFMSQVAQGELKDLNLIVKADVQGSAEAIRGQLEKLRNEEVQVKIIHTGVGAITETDVMLASASKAIIIGFNVRPDDRAARAASDQGIDLRSYNVIYDIVDDIKAAMTGMLKPKIEEVILGRAEVRETFKVPKVGVAAGCRVISGKVTRNAKYRLIRDGVVVWHGDINALRRFKDEVKEVAEGYECGITLENYQDFKNGDILEAYELKEVKAVG